MIWVRRRLWVAIGAGAWVLASACALDLGGERDQITDRDAASDGSLGDGGGRSDVGAGDGAPRADAGDGGPDARPDPRVLCPGVCEEAGVGRCDDAGACHIDCTDGGQCPTTVTCPSGVGCNVLCGGQNACGSDVDCAGATDCEIKCSGYASCKAGVLCGRADTCRVACTTQNTCDHVEALEGGVVDIECSGYSSCQRVACSGTRCHIACTTQSTCAADKVRCDDRSAAPQRDGGCLVDCTGYGACSAGVVCTGQHCGVLCDVQNSCYSGVSATAQESEIACLGYASCTNGASCDGGNCGIDCAANACTGTICCKATNCSGPSANTCP